MVSDYIQKSSLDLCVLEECTLLPEGSTMLNSLDCLDFGTVSTGDLLLFGKWPSAS